jgi:hypothetical protein
MVQADELVFYGPDFFSVLWLVISPEAVEKGID